MVTMFFIYGTIIIANLITAWIVVNQKHAETEIILAKQRIEEITGSSEVSKEIPKGEKEIVFDFLAKEAYSHGGLQTGHTIYTRNNMGQKSEGNCGLWVLNEILKKTYAENLKKNLGCRLGVTC